METAETDKLSPEQSPKNRVELEVEEEEDLSYLYKWNLRKMAAGAEFKCCYLQSLARWKKHSVLFSVSVTFTLTATVQIRFCLLHKWTILALN